MFRRAIFIVFNILFFITPLFFVTKTSELFEFNKIIVLYTGTIVIACLWAIDSILHKKLVFRKTILDFPLLFFLITQGLATLFSIEPRTSLLGYYSRFNGGLLSIICYAILYWACVTHIQKKEVVHLLRTLFIATAIAGIWGALEHFGRSPSCVLITGNFDVACWVQDVQLRVYATFGQPNWMAAWFAALLPIMWVFVQRINTKASALTHLLYWTLITLTYSVLLFTKSRSGILGFGIGFVLFWGVTFIKEIKKDSANAKRFLSIKNELTKPFVTLLLIVGLITTVVGTPWTPTITGFFSGNQTSTQENTSPQGPSLETGGTESGEIRKIVWEGALEVWKQFPIVGSGVETFALSYYRGRPMAHNNTSEWNFLYNKAHNEYLNYLATTGLLGTSSYLLVIICSLVVLGKKALQKHKKKETDYPFAQMLSLALLSGYVSILVTNFFGFSVVPVSLLFFVFPAFALALENVDPVGKKAHGDSLQLILIGVVALFGGYLLMSVARYWWADYLYARGLKARDESDYSQSIKSLNSAIKLSPEEPLYHADLGIMYSDIALAAQDDTRTEPGTVDTFIDAAKQEFALVEILAPQNVRLMKLVSNGYSTLGNIDSGYILKLISVSHTVSQLAPTDPAAVYQRAFAFAKISDNAEAIAQAEKAVLMKPDYKIARRLLAVLYTNAKQFDKARAQYEYILKYISPSDTDVQKQLETLKTQM